MRSHTILGLPRVLGCPGFSCVALSPASVIDSLRLKFALTLKFRIFDRELHTHGMLPAPLISRTT